MLLQANGRNIVWVTFWMRNSDPMLMALSNSAGVQEVLVEIGEEILGHDQVGEDLLPGVVDDLRDVAPPWPEPEAAVFLGEVERQHLVAPSARDRRVQDGRWPGCSQRYAASGRVSDPAKVGVLTEDLDLEGTLDGAHRDLHVQRLVRTHCRRGMEDHVRQLKLGLPARLRAGGMHHLEEGRSGNDVVAVLMTCSVRIHCFPTSNRVP
jgi:hypothetical protein